MFFFHADDYGINIEQSKRIIECREHGCLNSVSIIPNGDLLAETMSMLDNGCKKGIHINLCEGRPLSAFKDISLLVGKDGYFNKSFLKLLLMSFLHGEDLENQVFHECYNQINQVLYYLPNDYKIRIDSHRHYHMIPVVLRGLCRAIEKTGKDVEYFRIPVEDFGLYIQEPKLWKNISILSIVKAIVLFSCFKYNKSYLKKKDLISKSCKYIGVIFTDRMFLSNILPLINRIKSDKKYEGCDIEVQFHPGAVYENEYLLDDKFREWYASANRKKEAETLLKMAGD